MIWLWKAVTLPFISQSYSRLLLKMVLDHSLLRIKGQSASRNTVYNQTLKNTGLGF